MNFKTAGAVVLLGIAVGHSAHAQSIASFKYAEMSGVESTLSNLKLTVLTSATPTLTIGGKTFRIDSISAIYSLDDTDDMLGTGAGSNMGWAFNANYTGIGGIAGWRNNTNFGLTAGQSKSYFYNSLRGSVESFGYQVTVDGALPGGGQTDFFRVRAVPEPGSLAALLIGGLYLIRRRK